MPRGGKVLCQTAAHRRLQADREPRDPPRSRQAPGGRLCPETRPRPTLGSAQPHTRLRGSDRRSGFSPTHPKTKAAQLSVGLMLLLRSAQVPDPRVPGDRSGTGVAPEPGGLRSGLYPHPQSSSPRMRPWGRPEDRQGMEQLGRKRVSDGLIGAVVGPTPAYPGRRHALRARGDTYPLTARAWAVAETFTSQRSSPCASSSAGRTNNLTNSAEYPSNCRAAFPAGRCQGEARHCSQPNDMAPGQLCPVGLAEGG